MFRKKKPSEVEVLREEFDERFKSIEDQIEGNASRVSELSKKLEDTSVELRTSLSKEVKQSIEEVRTSLETLGLEINNQTLDLSNRVEKNAQNAANWSFAVNEQIEEFRKIYVDVLEDLRKAKDLAVEKERVLTEKYESLVTQLKEKESIAVEKENLSVQRIKSLQEEIEKKQKELEDIKAKLIQLTTEVEQKGEVETKAKKLEIELKRLKEDHDIQKYELERAQSQIKSMSEDSRREWGTSKALKIFLGESESGRILGQMMSLEETNIDELASLTGISTYNVNQIVNRFRDMGILTLDNATRRVRLTE